MSDYSSSPGGQVQTITGMRGGLGRTLLSAFLLLTIVPLAAISFLAVNWARRDLRQEVAAKLAAVAWQKEAEINAWTTTLTIQLDALADNPANQRVFLDPLSAEIRDVEAESLARRTLEAARNAGAFGEIGLLDADGQVLVTTDSQRFAHFPRLVPSLVPSCLTDPVVDQSLILAWCAVQDDKGVTQGYLVGLADRGTLDAIMTRQTNLGETGETYLVSPQAVPLTALRFAADGSVVQSEGLRTEAVEAALSEQEGVKLYTGYYGEPVIGVYRWLPSLRVALIAEQAQGEAFARDDALATLLIGATLAVALLTALLAAVITRQLSRPIVQLTLTAVKIAGGDLEQRVPVERRDEIGILAQAFNIMTTELRSLYRDLERKVAERTRQLRESNQRLRYRTMQLTVSAEVGRTITSILDLDQLLQKVVELIRNSYRLLRVDVYLLDESGHHVVRRARIGWDDGQRGSIGLGTVHRGSLMGRAVADERPQLDDLRVNLAIPLRASQRVIGVLRLQTYRGDEFSEDDVNALQSLADQISVAIQNAQTYAVEKGTVERLRRLDKIRTLSLSNMSRELATSLNSIIGFSRLILKGVDGPLTDQQHSDVSVINRSGQHLLGLLDDILELIDLESGAHPLDQALIELDQIVADVIDEMAPLAKDRAVALRSECSANLPLLQADGARLHQVLAHLVSNAVETAGGDAVTVNAWLARNGDEEIVVRVASGAGTPWACSGDDLKQVLDGLSSEDLVWDGTDSSIRLILSKRIIELHGGHLWVGGGLSQPAAFVFTLPVAGVASHSPAHADDPIGGQPESIL
jgi:signal transduction histidine kinase/HAMP domain-containing protein